MRPVGRANILPKGSLPPVNLFGLGEQTLIVKDKQRGGTDREDVYVKFPDGFIKTIQTNNTEHFCSVLSLILKGRYGVEAFEFISVGDLSIGSEIVINIIEESNNGK